MAVDTTTAPGGTQAPGAGAWPPAGARCAGGGPRPVQRVHVPRPRVCRPSRSPSARSRTRPPAASRWITSRRPPTASTCMASRPALELSVVTAIVPGIVGFLVAYAIFTARRGQPAAPGRRSPRPACSPTSAASRWPSCSSPPWAPPDWSPGGSPRSGCNPYEHGFDLYTLSGIVIVYMYFQIPLMVLVILPALEGLRPAWREAAQNLGASSWQFWRYIGGPVLLPVVPRLRAAAVRQRAVRLRHSRGADQRQHRADRRSRSARS